MDKVTIEIPPRLREMLLRNTDAINRLQAENRALLSGWMAGAEDLDTSKTYTVADDFSHITEQDNDA